MIRRTILFMAIGLFCGTLFAQNNMPSALDNLAIKCQEVIVLNDTINARQIRLNDVKLQLDTLTQNWWKTCNEALSSSACDDSNTRISIINELIRLTDENYEKDLYAQLKDAKKNPQKRSLTPVNPPSSATGRGKSNQQSTSPMATTPPTGEVTDPIDKNNDDADLTNGNKGPDGNAENPINEQPAKGKSNGKNESSTSPSSQDSKRNSSGKEVSTDNKNVTGNDKTKLESNDQTNRNNTINAIKDKIHKNK